MPKNPIDRCERSDRLHNNRTRQLSNSAEAKQNAS